MNKKNFTELREISTTYNPVDVVNRLEFDAVLHLTYDMLNNDKWDESLQEYATSILEQLRRKYPEKWNSS